MPGVRPTDRGAVFNDATCSSAWFSTPDNKTPLPLSQVNAAGYPIGDFAQQIFYKCPPSAYNGIYSVEIDGTVTGIAGLSSPLKVGPIGSIGGDVPPKTFAQITVSATKPGETASMTLKFTGVSNVTKIRIWRGDPPADRQRRLHTVPIALLKNANAGVIRGMEFRRINSGRLVVDPADMTRLDAPTYCYAGPGDGYQTGCPSEFLFDACNEAGADCWDNVWIDATDETATVLFALARDRLRPDVFYRFQLHNELWNNRYAFKRAHDLAQQLGAQLALNGEPGFVGINDPNVLGWRYNAYRSVQLVKLARATFGPDQQHRVRGTLCGHMNDNRPLDEARAYLRDVGIKPSDYFDAYAVTHYFGSARGTVEETIAALPADAVAALTHRDADQFFQACAEDGTEPQGYETGIGIESGIDGFVAAVMRDPRTKGANLTGMQAWRAKGGGRWVKFTSWGDWGRTSYAATDNPTWVSPTLEAFAKYGPQWPYTAVPVKPDPNLIRIAALEAQVKALEAQLADKTAEAAKATAVAVERGNKMDAAGVHLTAAQQALGN